MVDVTQAAAYPWPPPSAKGSGSADGGDTPLPPPPSITAEELAAEIGIPDDEISRAERLLAVASKAVDRYAPLAPTTMKNEAVIRYAGYLTGSDYGGVKSESIGPRSVEYSPPSTHAAMFRNCGAAGLLTHYKKRRAGSVGT